MPLALCHEDRRDNVTLFVPFLTRSTVGLRPRYAGVSEEVTEVMKVMSGRKTVGQRESENDSLRVSHPLRSLRSLR